MFSVRVTGDGAGPNSQWLTNRDVADDETCTHRKYSERLKNNWQFTIFGHLWSLVKSSNYSAYLLNQNIFNRFFDHWYFADI